MTRVTDFSRAAHFAAAASFFEHSVIAYIRLVLSVNYQYSDCDQIPQLVGILELDINLIETS